MQHMKQMSKAPRDGTRILALSQNDTWLQVFWNLDTSEQPYGWNCILPFEWCLEYLSDEFFKGWIQLPQIASQIPKPQPIETAPKDTPVLVTGGEMKPVGEVVYAHLDWWAKAFYSDGWKDCTGPIDYQPKYWLPMPKSHQGN